MGDLPWRYRRRAKGETGTLDRIPGPGYVLPFGVGLDVMKKWPWELSEDLAERWGGLAMIWVGSSPMVFVQEPELIESVLVRGDVERRVFKASPLPAFAPATPKNTSSFTENGKDHAYARQISPGVHPAFGSWLEESSVRLVDFAAREASEKLTTGGKDLAARLERLVFDAFCTVLVGERLDDGAYRDFLTVFKSVNFRMKTGLPVVGFGFRRARERWWENFTRRAEHSDDNPGLISRTAKGARNTKRNFAITVANMFPAGAFSVASALTNTLVLVARHPEVERELRAAIGGHDGAHDARSLAEIEPLERVIRESLRLEPPVPLFLRRVGAECLELGDHVIPAGTDLAIGTRPIHRGPSYWEDPLSFRPERWDAETRSDHEYGSARFFPFGRGVRSCEGQPLALMVLRALSFGLLSRHVLRAEGEGLSPQRFFLGVMMPTDLEGALVPHD